MAEKTRDIEGTASFVMGAEAFRPDGMVAVKDADASMGLARLLSWLMLVLIVASTLFLTFFIANSARGTLVKKAEDTSLLLAENLNHQIYTRFFLPTAMKDGVIALRRPDQYERLDLVIQTTIHGMQVDELRIFDPIGQVSYSTNEEELGREDMASDGVSRAVQKRESSLELMADASFLQAMFMPSLPPNTFRLRTTRALMSELSPLAGAASEPDLMGALEMTQDITQDMRDVVRFVWVSVAASLVSAAMLFILLQFIIRKAEQVLSARVKEQQRLERVLHQHEKLASMGRVVASIAHEVRNPLGIIRSSAELLITRAKDADKVQLSLLEAIHDESRRLSRTVTDFLDYARPRQPKDDPVSVNGLLDEALAFLLPSFEERGITVESDLAQGLTTKGDKELLYRAIYNVLINAVQAMKDAPPPLRLGIRGRTHEGMIEIAIRDKGPGFDPDLLDRVTDPFFTTKEEGTGLGLAIVNSIVATHGGRLRLGNAEQGGAVVTIQLPSA